MTLTIVSLMLEMMSEIYGTSFSRQARKIREALGWRCVVISMAANKISKIC